MRTYVYPDVGRAGLGNMLFPWARAVLWSKSYNVSVINPTWYKFRIGPYLRRENDKRRYHLLFKSSGYISGIRKFWLLCLLPRYSEQDEWTERDSGIRVFSGLSALVTS